MNEVTRILSAIEQGDGQAGRAAPAAGLRRAAQLAAQKLAQEKPGQTLQATALVHEAYLRLVDEDQVQGWNSRGHFFAAAAEAMRRILINRARDKDGRSAGGGRQSRRSRPDWSSRIEASDRRTAGARRRPGDSARENPTLLPNWSSCASSAGLTSGRSGIGAGHSPADSRSLLGVCPGLAL